MATFKVHVHREYLFNPEKERKWFVHFDDWGTAPRAFRIVYFKVPCETFVAPERPGCGCAIAWIAGDASLEQMHEDDDGVLTIG